MMPNSSFFLLICERDLRYGFELMVFCHRLEAIVYKKMSCSLICNLVVLLPGILLLNNCAFAQIVVSPPSLYVNLGYFTLYVDVPSNTVPSCTIEEAVSTGNATSIAEAPSCLRNISNIATTYWDLYVATTPTATTLHVSSRMSPALQLNELLVVSCCESTTSSSSSVITVDVASFVSVNFTTPTTSPQFFANPAFVNIAPCPCDLTLGRCDINCCCDAECSAGQTQTFACATGFFGGDFNVDDDKFCTTQQTVVPDWLQFTCIQFLNSPDLGLYFANTSANLIPAQNDVAFSVRLTQNPPLYTYEEGTVTSTATTTGYSNGDPILISTTPAGYLTLTQRSLSGQCVPNSIVAFQNDSDADCDVTVTSSLCGSNTILDVNSYLTNNNPFGIIAGPTGDQIQATYFCDSATNYVKTTSSSTTTGRSLFNGTARTAATPCVEPGIPTYDGTLCRNAVVNVTYKMTWDGPNVAGVLAEITVANVSLTDISADPTVRPNNVLTQSFRLRFEHAIPANANLTFRSGNGGYMLDYPVISGYLTSGATSINTGSAQQLQIWQPGSGGLCADSSKNAPPYGRDVLSGCQVRLSISDFDNCDTLRQLVEEQQLSLIGAATHVARTGNPNPSDITRDWITIDTSGLTTANQNTTQIAGQCSDIPAHAQIEFVTSLTGRLDGFPILEVVGAKVSLFRETWMMTCAGTGACEVGGSSLVESFSVMSSSTFATIPAVQEAPPTLAELQDTKSCDKDAACWSELPLPLTGVYVYTMPLSMATLVLEENIAWSLLLVLFTIAAALLPFHWSSIGRYVKHTFPL